MPIHCNLLWQNREQAFQAPKGDIRLTFCRSCGYIFNIDFDPDKMKYDQMYENSLHCSTRFKEYAKTLALSLIEQFGLKNKKIIEIGCGKGEFLKLLCDLGQNEGIGFDPSYIHGRITDTPQSNITFIQDFYSERYSDYKADIIFCLHVLEHIQNPYKFLNSIRRSVSDRIDTVIFFEVPNVLFTLKDLSIWDLIYEHCGYFCINSLAYLFNVSGFNVINIEEAFEGQFLNIYAMPLGDESQFNHHDLDIFEKMEKYVTIFASKYDKKIKHWQRELNRIEHNNQKIVVWGSGSKGVSFLNTLKIEEQIKYAVDINPHKQGKYIAGTGQKIVNPLFLRDYRPDLIIIMNPIYEKEIQQTVNKMNLTPEILVV